MNILSVSISTVNPTAPRSAAIRRPATMPKSAVALGRARDPITGRFVAFSAPWGVQTVMLPTGIVAYRVGPNGQIFGDLKTAKRNAAIRRPSYLAPAEPAKPISPVHYRGWESTAPTTTGETFGAGLGVEVDAEDLHYEAMYAESLAIDAMCSGFFC